MSLVAEFVLPAETFVLGDALEREEIERVEFACNIPTRIGVMPYFWVWGSSFEAVKETIQEDSSIRGVELIDTLENSRLYRAEWATAVQDFLDAIRESDGLLKTAVGEDQWEFEIVFEERDDLATFSERCTEFDLGFELRRVHSLTEPVEGDYGLTPAQRETLITAEHGGYFNQPRDMTMEEFAEEMELSPAAVSGRLRRGLSNLIQRTLLSDK